MMQEKLSLERAMELARELKAQGREDDSLLIARMVALLEEKDMSPKLRKALKKLEKTPGDADWEKQFLKDLEEGRFHFIPP